MADQSQSVAKVVEVQASWDPEAKVWVATCSEIEGLVTEAPTKEELEQKLRVMIPELLEPDGGSGSDLPEVPFVVKEGQLSQGRLRA